MIKNYILDTNVLLQNPHSIFEFGDNCLWICGTTLQELDHLKSVGGETGYNAREICRILDEMRLKGSLLDGIKMENGGTLLIEPDGVSAKYLPDGFSLDVPDNRIISTCIFLNATRCQESPVILLTNDISMRVNASICGLCVEGVKNDKVKKTNYTGHTDIDVPQEVIDELYAKGNADASDYKNDLLENEFVTLHNGNQSGLSIFRSGCFNVVKEQRLFGGVRPLNKMQTYAIHALMAPVEEIPLVILSGPAGTAKTFLSLAAGLTQTYSGQGKQVNDEFRKMMISRPNAGSSDPGFGYLPGHLDEKMAPLLASYYDNLEELIRNKGGRSENPQDIKNEVDDLFAAGIIEIVPLNYIRGRSISDSYIICDEAENATKNLIRDVVTRAGRGSKVIVTGDERQCDVPGLDEFNNGLVYLAEKMKGSSLCAIVRFSESNCVRSKLAETASRMLK